MRTDNLRIPFIGIIADYNLLAPHLIFDGTIRGEIIDRIGFCLSINDYADYPRLVWRSTIYLETVLASILRRAARETRDVTGPGGLQISKRHA